MTNTEHELRLRALLQQVSMMGLWLGEKRLGKDEDGNTVIVGLTVAETIELLDLYEFISIGTMEDVFASDEFRRASRRFDLLEEKHRLATRE